jgi:nucleotide-binding universal stress UspA family protein
MPAAKLRSGRFLSRRPCCREVDPVFERILLAITEAEEPAQTMDAVAALAKAFSADVTVYHARERMAAAGGLDEQESIPQAYEYTERMAGSLTDRGVAATPVFESVKHSELADRVLEQADATRADLIVLGSHHPHALREAVFGDIGKALAHRAGCPVLVMPSAASVVAG